MSTSSELKERDIRSKEQIAREDRRQRRESEMRGQDLNYAGKVIGTMGGIIGKMNDPEFYKRLPGGEVVNASIPDFQTLGIKDPRIATGAYWINGNMDVNVPAVVQVKYIPTLGAQRYRVFGSSLTSVGDTGDAANRALNRVVTQLEQRNSRISTYSRDTVGRYLFIATDIASDLLRAKTAIDVFDLADATKPFISRQIIRALGFNYQNFKSNIANIRSQYVLCANDFNSGIPLPSDLSFTKRQLWLNNTIIKDMKSDWCSYLVFCKAYSYRFGDSSLNAENDDEYYPIANAMYGISDGGLPSIKSRMETLINGATWKPLIRDLRGGTKDNSWLKLPTDVLTKTVKITDFDEVRSQVHNMQTLPLAVLDSDADASGVCLNGGAISGNTDEAVVQNAYYGGVVGNHHTGENTSALALLNITPGSYLMQFSTSGDRDAFKGLIDKFMTQMSSSVFSYPYILDSYGKMSSDSALVSSRLKLGFVCRSFDLTIATGQPGYVFTLDTGNIVQSAVGTKYYVAITPVQYGTEIITGIMVMNDMGDNSNPETFKFLSAMSVYHNSGYLVSNSIAYFSTFFWANSGSSGLGPFMTQYALLTSYDWHPLIDFTLYNFSGDYVQFHRVLGELDHYTTYAPNVQDKLNEQAVESEFTLPASIYLKPLA